MLRNLRLTMVDRLTRNGPGREKKEAKGHRNIFYLFLLLNS